MAVMTGEVDLMVTLVAQASPQILAGKLRALAVTTEKRMAALPDVPTVAEAGYEAGDGTFTTWAPEDRAEAPVIAGETFAGDPVDLADWRGDVVVLNFWYAACPPCRAEAPDFAAVANDYADDGVHLLGINGTDDAATADAFAATFAIPYPSLNDSSASAVAALEGLVPLKAMPTTVILDREGRPAARIIGPASGITLRSLIDDIAAES